MANRYWVSGGTGDWNSTTNWSATSGGASGASVPGIADTVLFNASSGSGTVVLDISATIISVTFNGFTGTFNFGTNTLSLNGTGTIFTGSTLMTVAGTPIVNCTNATATARTINPTNVTASNSISFNITAGTGVFSVGTTTAVKNLNFTGFAGSWAALNNTLYGSLTLSNTMTVTAGATTTFAATSETQTITTNGVTFDRNITFNGVGGTFAFQDALTQGSTRNFTVTNGTVQLKNSVTSTVGNFVTSGANQKFLQSTLLGSQATLSEVSGTVNASNLTIRDINATGGATWNAYVDQSNIDAGNNDGWNFGISPVVGGAEYTYTIRSFTQPRRF